MPRVKALPVQWLAVTPRCIEHHLDDTFDVPVRRFQSTDIQTKSSSDGRADLSGVQDVTFYLTALDDIFGQGLEQRFLLHLEAKRLHSPQEPALLMTYERQLASKLRKGEGELGPAGQVMDVGSRSPRSCRD